MPIKTQIDDLPGVNLTPMIDVVFLLIIFFMVGTKFTELERQISLQVPSIPPPGALTAAPEKRVINVYENGEITLDGDRVTLEELTQRMAAARSQYTGIGVLIRGDAGGRFQQVAEALGACKKAGVSELGISVRIARNDKR